MEDFDAGGFAGFAGGGGVDCFDDFVDLRGYQGVYEVVSSVYKFRSREVYLAALKGIISKHSRRWVSHISPAPLSAPPFHYSTRCEDDASPKAAHHATKSPSSPRLLRDQDSLDIVSITVLNSIFRSGGGTYDYQETSIQT